MSRRQWWPLQTAGQRQDIKVTDPKPGPPTPLCGGLSLHPCSPQPRAAWALAEVTLRTPFWGQHSPKMDSSEGQGEGDRKPSLRAFPACPFPQNQRAELLRLRLQWSACWRSPGEEAGPAASLVRSLSPLGNPCLPPVASMVGAPRGDESRITQPGTVPQELRQLSARGPLERLPPAGPGATAWHGAPKPLNLNQKGSKRCPSNTLGTRGSKQVE